MGTDLARTCRGSRSPSPPQEGSGTQLQDTLLQSRDWEGGGPGMCLRGSLSTAGEAMGTRRGWVSGL